MTPEQRNEVRELAAKNHGGDLNAAALEFLGATPDQIKTSKEPKGFTGFEGAAHAIEVEVETYPDTDTSETAKAKGKTKGTTQ